MKKIRRTVAGVVVLGVVVAVLDYFDAAELKFGKEEALTTVTQEQLLSGFEHLSVVTGELWSSPGSFAQRKKTVTERTKMDGRIYQITDKDAQQLLRQKAKTWPVRLIVENKMYQWNASDFKKLKINLEENGVQIKTDEQLGTNFVHAKTFFSDEGFVIETANLSHTSFTKNREFFFASHDREVVASLEKLFEQDRAGKKISPSEIHPNLLFCPIDCRAKIEHLLKSAQKSLRIYNQYITDPAVLAILKEKTKLDLRVILPESDDNLELKQYFGSQIIKLMPKKMRIHAKVFLVDDRFLVISSVNFSSNSMDENREIGVITTDRGAIEKRKGVFGEDWGGN